MSGFLASRFTRIAAHELAHQWFGNLVTPAWWDDLWLSEAFASWLGDKVWAQLGLSDDPVLRLALSREQALEADDAADAKPLRRSIMRNSDPDSSYDEIAYEKGQAVLATFEAWIGEDAFRAALRRYLHDHRDGTVTSADLIAAIAAATTPEVGAALASYVAHAGAPVVHLALHCEGAPYVEAHADHAITVPVCVRYAGGRACALVGEHTDLPLASCPKWLYGNDHGGYYHAAWTTRDPSPPIEQLPPADRIARGDDLAASFDRGDLAIADAFAAIRALVKSRDAYAQLAALAIARTIDPLVDDATRPAWSAWLAARFADRLTPSALFGELPPAASQLRDDLVALVPADRVDIATQREAAREVARVPDAVEPLHVTIAAPVGGRALFDRIVALAHKNADAIELLGDFGADMIPPMIDLVTASDLPIEPAWSALAAYLDRGATRTAAWAAVRAQVPAILARMTATQAALVIDATASLCDPAARAEVAAAFEPRLQAILDGRRRLDHALASIDRCIAHRGPAAGLAAALQP